MHASPHKTHNASSAVRLARAVLGTYCIKLPSSRRLLKWGSDAKQSSSNWLSELSSNWLALNTKFNINIQKCFLNLLHEKKNNIQLTRSFQSISTFHISIRCYCECDTYSEVSPFICLNASLGITWSPQLCIANRFSLCNPWNASGSIRASALSDRTLHGGDKQIVF